MRAPTLDFEPCRAGPLLPAPAQSAVAIALLGIWALAMLVFPWAAIGTAGLLAAAAILFAAILAYRHPQWRIFALLLMVETLPSANFLPLTGADRPALRYPLYLLFCAPLLPRMWRSGILTRRFRTLLKLFCLGPRQRHLFARSGLFARPRHRLQPAVRGDLFDRDRRR
jgi:hypothetical protein